MSKRSRKSQEQPGRFSSRQKLIGGLVLLAVVIVAVAIVFVSVSAPAETQSQSTVPVTIKPGNVLYCINTRPPFVEALGFDQSVALDTRARFVKGAMLRELDADGNVIDTYQHPSWSEGGYLGSHAVDQEGNIYLAPMPFIGILDNPPEKANIIYRIDSKTGVMNPMIDLPAAAPHTPENVYGLTDLAYDCDTNTLYASSVMGSTYDNVAGRIYQIELSTGKIKATLEQIDAFSLAVFNGASGKRLYVGMARVPEIYSIPLDDHGDFAGEMRSELSLENMGWHRDDRPRSLIFQGEDHLLVDMLQFDFNLVASTERRETYYQYGYNAQDDSWQLLSSYVVNG